MKEGDPEFLSCFHFNPELVYVLCTFSREMVLKQSTFAMEARLSTAARLRMFTLKE